MNTVKNDIQKLSKKWMLKTAESDQFVILMNNIVKSIYNKCDNFVTNIYCKDIKCCEQKSNEKLLENDKFTA